MVAGNVKAYSGACRWASRRIRNRDRTPLAGGARLALWSKQYFNFDVTKWLGEHGANPFLPADRQLRNHEWFHMVNEHIISMPDKWEYPWYAAWDLAFHAIALSTVDLDFAKQQLELLL